jgi:hypothetical protein
MTKGIAKLFNFNGEIKTLAEWARVFNIPQQTLKNRIYSLKWDINKTLNTAYNEDRRTIKPEDYLGKSFYEWTVLEYIKHNETGHIIVKVRCSCGSEKEKTFSSIKSGQSTCCGCKQRKIVAKTMLKHGVKSKHYPSEYKKEHAAWQQLKNRCYNKKDNGYKHYGGRGISVCERWKNNETGFLNFLEDVGKAPSHKHSIDRINNNKNYSCGKCSECVTNVWNANCRWATSTEQNNNNRNNKIVTYEGISYTLSQLSKISLVSYSTFCRRLRTGWSLDDAINTPSREKNNEQKI